MFVKPLCSAAIAFALSWGAIATAAEITVDTGRVRATAQTGSAIPTTRLRTAPPSSLLWRPTRWLPTIRRSLPCSGSVVRQTSRIDGSGRISQSQSARLCR